MNNSDDRGRVPRRVDPGDYDADFWNLARSLPGTALGDAPASRASAERSDRPRQAAPPSGRSSGTAAPPSVPPPPVIPPPPAPGSVGPAHPGRRPRRRRRTWLRVVLGLLALLVVAVVGAGFWAWRSWDQVERVAVSPALSATTGAGTNYLLVGSDSREGITDDDPNAAALIGEEVLGQRSDTVMILRIDGAGARFLSLPRDLWLPIAGTGRQQRLNTAYADGPERLIRTVDESLGIPVNHYVEIDLATFADVVDALGGVTVDFAHPAYDQASGLDVPVAGAVELDGSQALAYVRSRHYTEIIDGQPTVEPTGDIGRGLRQQAFLRTVLAQSSDARGPLTAKRLLDAVTHGITVDDTLDLRRVVDLALSLRNDPPESVELPVYNWTTDSGAAVLGLADGAEAVLAGFRG